MRKVILSLAGTAACITAILGVKAQSAGPPRPALGARSTAHETGPGHPPVSSAPSPGKRSSAPVRSGLFTGSSVDTPYGAVQVQAVLAGGKLTDVVVLRQTDGGRSGAIDAYALPILKSEVLKKQSADVDVVSGATYTSTGYAQSLQAALDAAGR
ncbi:FMN-binding protein [Streptomyces sp. NBC_01198]|uniref:FMN-binding protein n=1 Tax=Streptomyces sp. NBC_01198 TaxID=2903769 RepID=UPI002E164837|nr:FMN-binding protein [Streptomyces sp. NBC_01198]